MNYGICVECEATYHEDMLNICEECGVSVCDEHYNQKTELCDFCNEMEN